MNRRLIIIIIVIGICGSLLFFFGVKPIFISHDQAIVIVSKADGCDRHSWQLAKAEAHLWHVKNGWMHLVEDQTGTNVMPSQNKFAFGYQWQVILNCQANGIQPEIVDWVDAFTGKIIS